jgi:hypothetical protein
MSFKAILIFILLLPMSGWGQEGDERIWRLLANGDRELSIKTILTRPVLTHEDQIMHHFMLLYYFYKQNRFHECMHILNQFDTSLQVMFSEEQIKI